jgi:alkylmercury lyase
MARNTKTDPETIASSIVGVFPKLDVFEQRLSFELYRLLAGGHPVPAASLAERLQASVETIHQILKHWPGVFFDSQQRVVGYWGLSIAAFYSSPHRFTIDGQKLSAWCAWDTLFLPQLLGKKIAVESASPTSGLTVSLLVAPNRVAFVEPADAQMSFLVPDAAAVEKNFVTTFCHFVHFFPSRHAGEAWVEQHPGTFLLSIDEGYEVARRKNRAQYEAVLR